MHPKNRAQRHTKQTLTGLKGEIRNSTIMVGDFNILLSIMDITTRQSINKETENLSSTINQPDLTDTMDYFTQQEQNTFSSQVHMEHSPRQTLCSDIK